MLFKYITSSLIFTFSLDYTRKMPYLTLCYIEISTFSVGAAPLIF